MRLYLSNVIQLAKIIVLGTNPLQLIQRLIAVTLFSINACQPQVELAQLPTLMLLPSVTQTTATRPTLTPPPTLITITEAATIAPSQIQRPSPTPSATITDTPTVTRSPTITSSPTPTGDAKVIGEKGVNLREGPSTSFTPPSALIETNTELILTGRTEDNRWYLVQTMEGVSGWAFGELLEIRIDPNTLPVAWFETPTAIPLVIGAPPNGNVQVTGEISPRVRQIYRDGLRRGNQPNAFSKVGDSITSNQPFLGAFGSGKYDLGSYAYLQDTIAYYDAATRRASLAASKAFNAAAVLSDLWADQFNCEPNESPIECEYRHNRPSIAIIMLGSVDMQIYTAEEFAMFLSEVVQTTISNGTIPVLTTFPNGDDFYTEESVEFNNVIRQIAKREQIPLIELRDPALALPDHGVQEDKFHLSQSDDEFMVLDRDEHRYGLILRDLLTMQMLDTIRRGVNS